MLSGQTNTRYFSAEKKNEKLNVKQICDSILDIVKLGIKERLNKEQTGFKELFTDYQPFYTINLLSNKELWQTFDFKEQFCCDQKVPYYQV